MSYMDALRYERIEEIERDLKQDISETTKEKLLKEKERLAEMNRQNLRLRSMGL